MSVERSLSDQPYNKVSTKSFHWVITLDITFSVEIILWASEGKKNILKFYDHTKILKKLFGFTRRTSYMYFQQLQGTEHRAPSTEHSSKISSAKIEYKYVRFSVGNKNEYERLSRKCTNRNRMHTHELSTLRQQINQL